MNSLSTKIITHYAYIEKEDKKFPLTQDQTDALRLILKNESFGKYVCIPDIQDPLWEPVWEWRAWEIKITKKQSSWINSLSRWICDFWVRHMMEESCWCMEKYGVFPIEFRLKLHEVYPKIYARDLTDSQRNTVLSQIKI